MYGFKAIKIPETDLTSKKESMDNLNSIKTCVKATDNNLTAIAYSKIKDDIMSNKFKPGECISGSQLAKILKMSRTPVREALTILANEGLVEIHNGVGIIIKSITYKDILELYEIRLALECIAVESLIVKNDHSNLFKLKSNWHTLKDKLILGELSDWNEIVLLDHQTHHFIVTSSGNTLLIELFENIEQRIRRIQYLSVFGQEDKGNIIDQHIELLESIIQNNTHTTIKLLKKHIQEAVSYIFTNPDNVAEKRA